MHPFALGFLQKQQNAAATRVDWEAAAKHYSAVRTQAPPQQQQRQRSQVEDVGGKRKRASKESKEFPEDAAQEDFVMPPETGEGGGETDYLSENGGDDIGRLLRQADDAPHSYEALLALVSALSQAGPERSEEYEQALERLLFEFPLLFGFWKKLARLQCERKGDWNKCEEVFERALEFVGHNPLIWVGYFEWLKDFGSLPPHLVRARMDQALTHAGGHWKAWPLWQCILDWEEEELFAAREQILALEQGLPPNFDEDKDAQEGNPDTNKNEEAGGPQSLIDINKGRMEAALTRLRALYAALLRTPLESSDLCWDRLKGFIEKVNRCSNKSRRGPRPGGTSEGSLGDGGAAGVPQRETATIVDVYDLLTDEQLPLLLQRLQQQKSATLQELQMPAESAAAANTGDPMDAAESRAAIKKRVSSLASLNAVDSCCWQLLRTELDKTLAEAEKRRPYEKATHRWFWHPDPLAPRRLQAWREYLAFEEKEAPHRLELLQGRCLEVCASYPEFWLRCARQRRQQGVDAMLQLLHFGATKVLLRRRDMGCLYASQLEVCGRIKEAAKEFEGLVRPPFDAASLKYFFALLQFYMRHPPETAADGRSHALLLLQEAADKYRDTPACAELLHLYRAKLVALHEGDTKKAIAILSRARECLPQSLPLLLLQLRLLQQQHAGDVQKILGSTKPLLADVLTNPDADVWLQWQVLKLQIHLYEFYGAPTEALNEAKEAATAFLERHREAVAALAVAAEMRRLPPQLLLPYGDKETEGDAAAATAADWGNVDCQANAEAWQHQVYQQQLQQQYAALGFDIYSCYNSTLQQQQQQLLLAASYEQQHQPQLDSSSSIVSWMPGEAAAATAAASASTVASSTSGSAC